MDDADCGINPVTGDKMGHNHRGLCMHPGCYKVIDHGLSHACGGDHGGANHGCGRYFCSEHLYLTIHLCRECYDDLVKRTNDPDVDYVQNIVNTVFYTLGMHRPLPFPEED